MNCWWSSDQAICGDGSNTHAPQRFEETNRSATSTAYGILAVNDVPQHTGVNRDSRWSSHGRLHMMGDPISSRRDDERDDPMMPQLSSKYGWDQDQVNAGATRPVNHHSQSMPNNVNNNQQRQHLRQLPPQSRNVMGSQYYRWRTAPWYPDVRIRTRPSSAFAHVAEKSAPSLSARGYSYQTATSNSAVPTSSRVVVGWSSEPTHDRFVPTMGAIKYPESHVATSFPTITSPSNGSVTNVGEGKRPSPNPAESPLRNGLLPKRVKPNDTFQDNFSKLDLLCSATLEVGPLQESGPCSCPKSKCIALYCDCFKAGRRCTDRCTCLDCKNTVAESGANGMRTRAIQLKLARNPRAFTGGPRAVAPPGELVCNCVRSRCLKLYCNCFQNGKVCNPSCTCVSCLNTEAENRVGGCRTIAVQQCLEKRPDAFRKRPKVIGSGCACKNNRCIRKYCECFRTGLPCTDKCACRDCENQSHTTSEN